MVEGCRLHFWAARLPLLDRAGRPGDALVQELLVLMLLLSGEEFRRIRQVFRHQFGRLLPIAPLDSVQDWFVEGKSMFQVYEL